MAGQPFSARGGMERIGAAAVVALIIIPLVVGGLLTWAISTPTQQLSRVTAAIVNDDIPATVNGKSAPLGRQFAASLISGGTGSSAASAAGSPGSSSASNFTWVLTNDADAHSGLDSGRYAAVVTIPSTFSTKATSISGPASDAEQAMLQVTSSPSAAFIDPALTDAITAAATAALNRQLTTQYLTQIYGAFNTINEQIGQAATGATNLYAGAGSVADGAASLASGTTSLSGGLQSLDSGASSLAGGLATLDSSSQGLPGQTQQLAQGATGVAAATASVAGSLDSATSSFAGVVSQVCQTPGPVCDRATAALAQLESANNGASQLSAGAAQVAAGNQQLAAAMPQLVGGIDQSASGAAQVASGAQQADTGGASLATGASNLSQGAQQVDSGAAQLSESLTQAVQKIPTYSDNDVKVLSAVVAQPVLANQQSPAPGSQSVPLFAVVALWLGAIVIALARKAVPVGQLMTTASSLSLTLRTTAVSALLGMAQGLLVTALLPIGMGLKAHEWLSFVVLGMAVGAVFAVVNHGLAAAFGAAGRLVALFAAIIALSLGLSSTVPPTVVSIAALLPTTPALAMLRSAVIGNASDALLALGGCAVFCAIGLLLIFAGVAARRGIRARELIGRKALVDTV